MYVILLLFIPCSPAAGSSSGPEVLWPIGPWWPGTGCLWPGACPSSSPGRPCRTSSGDESSEPPGYRYIDIGIDTEIGIDDVDKDIEIDIQKEEEG